MHAGSIPLHDWTLPKMFDALAMIWRLCVIMVWRCVHTSSSEGRPSCDVAQVPFAFTLLQGGDHILPRPLLNVSWKCSHVYLEVRSDPPGCMLMLRLNRAKGFYSLNVSSIATFYLVLHSELISPNKVCQMWHKEDMFSIQTCGND